jgi:NADPH-dependent 2,4-dienoyl-CoA reductase/sulfur reductase-like enzyme
MNEEFIASGKTDLITMATPLFADHEYVQKAHEGRGEDIVPCIMCHDCHGICLDLGPWRDVCSVNPLWGLSETKKKSIRPSSVLKKVAVIGGGPAGMKAAITAAERGHRVTLYEKDDSLGGLLRHTDFSEWKWAQKNFKDYLVRQTHKAGVEVVLGTEVTPDKIKAGGYDTVLVATGAEPVIPRIPGADGKNVYNILEAYSKKKSLGKNVVLVGGGVYGTETGIGLALSGHKVTALTSEKYLIPPEVIGAHNKGIALNLIQTHENFSYVLEAITTGISEGKVTYREATGSEKSIRADSVVIYAGLSPRMDEAMKFSGAAGQVVPLGDCTGMCGTIQKTIRSAFFAASQV